MVTLDEFQKASYSRLARLQKSIKLAVLALRGEKGLEKTLMIDPNNDHDYSADSRISKTRINFARR